MTPEIPVSGMHRALRQAIGWLRQKHNLSWSATVSQELEQEFGLHLCMDQDGLVYAVRFETEAQHTWFMLRWSQ
jgi:hypothetical protein